MLRRLVVAIWLLAGTAYAQSPDVPPQGLVYVGGHIYALGANGSWWIFAGDRWEPSVMGPPISPPPEHGLLKVGPGEAYQTVSSAVAAANVTSSPSYYVIEVQAGTYLNDFSTVNRPMTIRAKDGPVILRATVVPNNGKAIIVANADLEVDGITFTGARNSSGNGAGIRDQNTTPNGHLTIRNCLFTLNDTGVLTTNIAHSMTTTVTSSKFINNGSPSIANPHALYVNSGKLLTVKDSLFCGQLRGHNIKSRTGAIEIADSELYDGAANPAVGCDRAGSTSRAIDISNGGAATITGNYILQGSGSPQFQIMSYGIEGLTYPVNTIVITHNTFSSPGTPHSTMLFDPHCVHVRPGSHVGNNVYDHIRTLFNPATCAAVH